MDIEQFLKPFMRSMHFKNEVMPILISKIERLLQIKLFKFNRNSNVLIPSARESQIIEEKIDDSSYEESKHKNIRRKNNSDL